MKYALYAILILVVFVFLLDFLPTYVERKKHQKEVPETITPLEKNLLRFKE